MGMFSQYRNDLRNEGEIVEPVVDVPMEPVVDPVDAGEDPAVAEPMGDPLEVPAEDVFAQQRARLNMQIGQVDEEPLVEEPLVGEPDAVVEEPVVEPNAEGEGEVETVTDEDMAVDTDLDTVESDESEIAELENQMRMMTDSAIAIESFGLNPTALAVMKTTGLLSGTALESMGLESIGFSAGKEAESQMALESLGEKIKETAARWSAKLLNLAKNGMGKVMSVLGAIWNKITSVTKRTVVGAAKTVKAHPVATIMAVVAAIAAVAGIIMFAGGNFPALGTKLDVMKNFGKELGSKISKIKWPFGKVTATVPTGATEATTKLLPNFSLASRDLVVVAQPAAKAGWTSTAIKAVMSPLSRAWSEISKAGGAFGTRVVKLAAPAGNLVPGSVKDVAKGVMNAGTQVGGHASRAALKSAIGRGGANLTAAGLQSAQSTASAAGTISTKMYYAGMVSLIMTMFKLARTIVVGGFRIILSTFRAVTGGGKEEPAAA